MFSRRILKYYWKRRRYNKFSKYTNVNFINRFGVLLLYLLGLIVAHTVAMMIFESLSLGDALWLSLTTITTVGYGDFSAHTFAGRVSTTLFIYSVGITLLAQLGAEYMEYRLTIREKKLIGRWKWKQMKDHILIINTPTYNAENYLIRLMIEIRKTPELQELPVQILSDKFHKGLPEDVTSFGVVYYNGIGQNSADLKSVNVENARYVIALSPDTTSKTSDSLNFDLLSRINELGTQAKILLEVCDDANRERMKKAGADILLRPMRAYPGLLVRSLVAPGSEMVFENLFTHNGDHMKRIDVTFDNLSWSDIVCRCMVAGAGTPMAYIDAQGQIDVHPLHDHICNGVGIITMVNDSQIVTSKLVAECLVNPTAIK